MISGVLASASPQALPSLLPKPRTSCCCYASSSVIGHKPCSSDLKRQRFGFFGTKGSQRSRVQCNSSTGPGSGIDIISVSSNLNFLYMNSVFPVSLLNYMRWVLLQMKKEQIFGLFCYFCDVLIWFTLCYDFLDE